MKMITLCTPAIMLALSAPVAAQSWTPAQERRLSNTYDQCIDAAAGNMPDMVQCTMAEHDIQDAKLNQAYRMVMTRLPTARRTALRTRQRGWIRARDTACRAVYDEAGGGAGFRSGTAVMPAAPGDRANDVAGTISLASAELLPRSAVAQAAINSSGGCLP